MRKMGGECKIPTPYSDFAYHAIKALEEKNQGKYVKRNQISPGSSREAVIRISGPSMPLGATPLRVSMRI